MARYPFVPKTTAHLAAGQLWSIPIADGRFGCGRVLRIDSDRAYGARVLFVGAILDWIGDQPPTPEAIAGRPALAVGIAHVRSIAGAGGEIVGERPLDLDPIEVPARPDTHWGASYPVWRVERRFIHGDPPPTTDFRHLRSPLTDEMLRPSTTGRGVVQFDSLLTDDDFVRLADWLRPYPEMTLRAYGGYDGSIRDLEFLRFLPDLRRFAADALWDRLESIDGLRHLPEDLEELGLGATRRPLDVSGLRRFPGLRELFLEGPVRGIEAVAGLTELDDLTFRSITLPDLSLLLPLRRLASFDLKLGGTKDLRLLPRIGEIRYLELWLIKGLTDVAPVGEMSGLRSLFLQALRGVTSLPDLSRCAALRRVHLETMKGLGSLAPLATAPALRDLVLIDLPQLAAEDLAPLVGLPGLRGVSIGLGSIRKNEAARRLIGLPEVRHHDDWRDS
jgi:internalin A